MATERENGTLPEIEQHLAGILAAYAAFLIGAANPGPNTLAIMGTSMSANRRAGLALALGVASGSFCWALLTMVGLTALVAAHAAAITTIKIVGGCYLLWLACKAFRSASSEQDIEAQAPGGAVLAPVRYFGRGLTVQMTNPKAALIWVAIISLGLSPRGTPLGWPRNRLWHLRAVRRPACQLRARLLDEADGAAPPPRPAGNPGRHRFRIRGRGNRPAQQPHLRSANQR